MFRAFFLFCSLFSIIFVYAKPLEVEIFAKSAILINADNGTVLFEKNANEKIFPASTTKIATTLYILERKKELLQKSFTASTEALKQMSADAKKARGYKISPYWLEPDGVNFEISKGETIPLRSLLYGILLRSGNDAANVAAEAASGSVSCFVDEMNQYLKSIGCLSTNFCNPHGLYYPDHVTTASDLAQMTKEALKNPEFVAIFKTKTFARPKTNKHETKMVDNINLLLKSGRFNYPYIIGGKTGFLAASKYNLVAAAEKDGRKLIAVVLGCSKTTERYQDAILLFEKAFQEKRFSRKIISAQCEFKTDIEGTSDRLLASLKEDLTYDFYPSEELEIKAYVSWYDLKAPLNKGDQVGEVKLMGNGQIIKTAPVYATIDLKRSFFYMLKNLFK
ncbi:MAG: D-alanyl-D-alanine carboxypeptidase [Chlamydiae bacterium]|nr:D-alanyl-D-alanine carboxypeptidase [Chlamydiota bacterium]